jgi:hypothetical protein
MKLKRRSALLGLIILAALALIVWLIIRPANPLPQTYRNNTYVEDQGVFTTPWSATVTYRRPLITEWPEIDCAENPHEYYSGKDAAVPRADKPDF